MDIKRDKYLNDLINRMHNGMINVTYSHRSGREDVESLISYLIFSKIICWRMV